MQLITITLRDVIINIGYAFPSPCIILLQIIVSVTSGIAKENILKYEKRFYQKLNSFIDYDASPAECAGRQKIPAECHIIERALYTIWNCDHEARGDLYDN